MAAAPHHSDPPTKLSARFAAIQRACESYGIFSPHDTRAARALKVQAAAERLNVSPATIRRARARYLKEGTLNPKPSGLRARPVGLPLDPVIVRSAGDSPASLLPLRIAVQNAVRELHLGPGTRHYTDAEITRQLYSAFPVLHDLYPCDRVNRETGELTRLDFSPNLYGIVNRLRKALVAELTVGQVPPLQIEAPWLNFQWQFDDSIADFFVQPFRNPLSASERGQGVRHPQRPYLSACIDSFSRSCMYATYGAHIDTGAWSALMLHSIERHSDAWPMCGLPQFLRFDQAKVNLSQHFTRFTSAFDISRDPCIGRDPESKGKIERFIGTLHHVFEATAPGYCGPDNQGDLRVDPTKDFQLRDGVYWDPRTDRPLWTVPQATEALHAWIIGKYHACAKRSLAGRAPIDVWAENAAVHPQRTAVPARDIVFAASLITVSSGGTRQVRDCRVEVDHLRYYSPELKGFEGCQLEVRQLWEDLSRVWVFYQDRLLTEATLLEPQIIGQNVTRQRLKEIIRDRKRAERTEREGARARESGPRLVGDPLAPSIAAALAAHDRTAVGAPSGANTLPPEWQGAPDPDAEKRQRLRDAVLFRKAANDG